MLTIIGSQLNPAHDALEIYVSGCRRGCPGCIKYYYDRLAIADQYGLSDCQFSVVIATQSEYQNTLGELYKEFRDALTMCKPEEFDAMYFESNGYF